MFHNFSKLRKMSYLADYEVLLIEVAPKHFRGLARNGLNLDAHLHALAGRFYRLVVLLDASDESQFNKLQRKVTRPVR